MPTYVAFLRAINLGATRKFPKDDIRAAAMAAGFENVETHINTGNVRVQTRMRSRARIERTLEEAFARDRRFDVPTIAFSQDELARVAADGTQIAAAHPGAARHYIYLLKEELADDAAAAVHATSNERGVMTVRGRAAHAILHPGYRDGNVDPLNASRHLGVCTSRTMTVISTLVHKWC